MNPTLKYWPSAEAVSESVEREPSIVSRRLLQSPSFEFLWQPQRGTYRFESPGRLLDLEFGVEVVQGRRSKELTTATLTAGREAFEQVEDVHGRADEVQLCYQEAEGLALSLRVRLYPGRPFALLRLAVTNVGPMAVPLRRFFVRSRPEGMVTTAMPSGFLVNGWQSWSPSGVRPIGSRGFSPSLPVRWLQGPMVQNAMTPWPGKPDRYWSETVGAVISPKEALIGGIVSLADQFGQMWADLRSDRMEMMLQTQLDDVLLAPGGSRQSEWFYLEWVSLPNSDPLAQYAHAVARQMEVASPRQVPTGWCSWYLYARRIGESDVMENLASAALLADELPLNVIQLDDGYQTAWGDWTTSNDRFPHSLQWLADRIRGSGFSPGLWLAPLVVEKNSRLARENPDWLLRSDSGRPVRAGLVSDFIGRALDPTHPGVLDFLHETIDRIVNTWGYDYLKLDFMYAGALPGCRADAQMTRAQAVRQAFRVIREAAGLETYLVGCGAPLASAVGLVDAMRVGPDTAPYWKPSFWGLGRVLGQNPTLPSLRNSLRAGAARAWIHGRWWVNDPDVLILREEESDLTEHEVLAQVTLAGLCGGATMLTDDLDNIPPERRALVAMLLPPLLDGMDVLDLFEKEMPEVAMVPVARPWGRWRLVALFNWMEDPVERELPHRVTLNERKAYHIVDFWERRYFLLGPGALRPVLHLPPHGVALLGIRSVQPDPHLVATTFHISQGGEITEWAVEKNALTLRLNLGRLAQGAVWLALPSRPTLVTLDDHELPCAAVRAVASGVWSITFRVRGAGTLRIVWDPQG